MSDKNPFGWEEEEDKREEVEEEDDLEDIPRKGETPEQFETRKEQRRERGKLFGALKTERERTARLESELQELRQGVQGMAEHQQRQNQPDPLAMQGAFLDREMERMRTEAQGIAALYREKGQPVPREIEDDWNRRYRAAEEQKTRVVTQRTLRDSGYQSGPQVQSQLLMAEYQDVQGHANASAFADGAYRQLVAEGHPPGHPETIRLAAEKARERFGLHKRPTKSPTAADRGRFAGTRSAAPSGDEERSPAMTPELRALARARYSSRRDLSNEQKERLWMREHGKEFRQLEAQRTGKR